jgi:hypothetical protein
MSAELKKMFSMGGSHIMPLKGGKRRKGSRKSRKGGKKSRKTRTRRSKK